MSYVLVALIVLSLWHLVYDGIISPAFRETMKNDFFKLRDELRNHNINAVINNEAFNIVEGGINNLIKNISNIDYHTHRVMKKEIQENPDLLDVIESRISIVKNSGDDEIIRIFNNANRLAGKIFLINSGAWFIYLIPIVVVITYISKLTEFINELVARPVIDTTDCSQSNHLYA